MSEPLILGFDTSAAHCAAALLRGSDILGNRIEMMARGQAERLMPLLEEILHQSGATWADLDAIGVGVGPGNFTGIRISVSAARGLALGLGIPAYGVTGFAARAPLALGRVVAIPGPRDQLYIEGAGLVPAAAHPDAWAEPSPDGLAPAIAGIAGQRLAAGEVPPPPAPVYLKPADAAPSRDVPPVILDDA